MQIFLTDVCLNCPCCARRDFIVQVIGRPVVVAGNSIGGFVSTSMAADNPSIVGAETEKRFHSPFLEQLQQAAGLV